MGKTYKRVPFNIELAKKIQSGKIEGRIYFETTLADNSKTDTYYIKSIHDLKNEFAPCYVIAECDNEEHVEYMRADGYIPQQLVHAVIELPEEVVDITTNSDWYKAEDAKEKIELVTSKMGLTYEQFIKLIDSIKGVLDNNKEVIKMLEDMKGALQRMCETPKA